MKKHLLKTIALVLALTLTATTAAFAAVPTDVKGQNYEEAVSALMEQGIITGDTDGNFHPDSELTRAQACVIIVKAMDAPSIEVVGSVTQPVKKSGFSDMNGYGWAEGYINYAVENNVVKGYPDGTFKPGNKVTLNELVTMVLRAADFTDDKLVGNWPENYLNKASELKLLSAIPDPRPVNAAKWMAAEITYSALDEIKTANPPAETPGQGAGQDKPQVPDAASMTLANASFNDTMTTYDGKDISKSVKLYTYGLQKDYSSTMTFSKKASDYIEETIYKYKNAKTPAFYKLENNKIVEMIVPRDAGFSGNAYVVINGVIKAVNSNGESVTGLETLTATREITWLPKSQLNAPAENEYLNGEVYELNLSYGEIKNISKAGVPGHKGKVFEEISGSGYATVDSYKDGVITLSTGKLLAAKPNASVYVLNDDATEYNAGRLSNIKQGVEIRAYDVTDDDDSSADIIVIKKN